MTRDEALSLLREHLQNKNLVKHCLSVVVHNLDYEVTDKSPELHTTETVKILRAKGIAEPIVHAVQAHAGKVPCESPMDWAIFSVDPLTALIICATLMHPTKKLKAIDLEFLKRRYKEKSFARGARREEIEECRHLGLELDEFLSIAIAAMQGIDAELGL